MAVGGEREGCGSGHREGNGDRRGADGTGAAHLLLTLHRRVGRVAVVSRADASLARQHAEGLDVRAFTRCVGGASAGVSRKRRERGVCKGRRKVILGNYKGQR